MSGPVRVAHVIHSLRPGGTERRLLAVAQGLDRSRYEPLIVCIDGLGELAEVARAQGLEPVVLGRRNRLDATGIGRLALLLRREGAAVVHGWLFLANTYACLAGAGARVPVRIASEGAAVTTRDARRAARDRAVDRLLAPLADAFVANSEAVATSLRARGLAPEKIVVIPNGVAVRPPLDEAARRRIRASLGARDGETLVGMVARLDAAFKDHGTFLAAVAQLRGEGRSVHAAVVGDGAARDAIEAEARRLGILDSVTFAGYRPDAAEITEALDVSVLLSYSEGFSNVVLETMTAGVPFVGTRIPPIEEAVTDGEHALLVPIGDVPATVAALRRLLDDRSLAGALAAAGRQRASDRYSLEAQANATMHLYDRLLAHRLGR